MDVEEQLTILQDFVQLKNNLTNDRLKRSLMSSRKIRSFIEKQKRIEELKEKLLEKREAFFAISHLEKKGEPLSNDLHHFVDPKANISNQLEEDDENLEIIIEDSPPEFMQKKRKRSIANTEIFSRNRSNTSVRRRTLFQNLFQRKTKSATQEDDSQSINSELENLEAETTFEEVEEKKEEKEEKDEKNFKLNESSPTFNLRKGETFRRKKIGDKHPNFIGHQKELVESLTEQKQSLAILENDLSIEIEEFLHNENSLELDDEIILEELAHKQQIIAEIEVDETLMRLKESILKLHIGPN